MARTGEGQILHIRSQCVIDGRFHGIDALSRVLFHHVPSVVHHVGVVADAAAQGIGTQPPIKAVVAAVANDEVVERVACAIDVARSGQGQVLHVGRKHIADRRFNRVDAFIGVFNHHITDVIHQVGVVACAALHGVCTCATVNPVVAAVTNDHVVELVARAIDVFRPGQSQVLHIGRERVVDGRVDRVNAFVGIFLHHVTQVVHHVGVVACAALHGVRTRPAINVVVTMARNDGVVLCIPTDVVVIAISRQKYLGIAVAIELNCIRQILQLAVGEGQWCPALIQLVAFGVKVFDPQLKIDRLQPGRFINDVPLNGQLQVFQAFGRNGDLIVYKLLAIN